ncbi:peptidase M24, structural domain-containing protein [Jimgerdemannia flammicorona]|uniref:Peptidase M24, structural domain-containing protein n=1 Tax=Jimgerdemannia flammicorona TaxID=994334 RepID=A0A433D095_9FUNG|nr:peptidase M24, structural domain-containing protein [Jimgerdemannia flammicorona]
MAMVDGDDTVWLCLSSDVAISDLSRLSADPVSTSDPPTKFLQPSLVNMSMKTLALVAHRFPLAPAIYPNLNRATRAFPVLKRPLFQQTNPSKPIFKQEAFGQPTWKTHPNIMQKGEITPGISAMEYDLRRTKLLMSLPSDSVVVLPGYLTRYMSNRVFYPFHQHTDFFYLCGFNEPDAALVMEKTDSGKGYKMAMFVPPRNAEAEMWDGPRTGLEAAKELFGADEAYESSRFPHRLKDLVAPYKHVYVDLPPHSPSLLTPETMQKTFGTMQHHGTGRDEGIGLRRWLGWLENGENDIKKTTKPLSPLVQELRVVKSSAEIAQMRKAGEISAKAFIQAMKYTKATPNVSEHQLYAKLDYECRVRGAQMLAYVPVVAGGSNALSMHYVRNDMILRDGDLVLVDCGGEFNGYASDITRTWPVNGKFTEPQRELYQAVLNVQKKCIKLCTEKEGISLHGIHDASVRYMRQELDQINFKIVEGDLDRKLYPHHVGHYLGLDVHDCHDLDRSRRLRKGMVITIEPGIYVPHDRAFPEKYRGIGIRIEDNVLVGEEDPVVLSAGTPKEVVDIEFCCNN